jgi:hypothetical protein
MNTLAKEQVVDLAIDLLEASPFASLFFALAEGLGCHIKPDYDPPKTVEDSLVQFKQVLMEQEGLANFIVAGYVTSLVEDTDHIRNQLEALITNVHVIKE